MGFDKRYPNRKDQRAPYHGSARFDRQCRPGGTCPYCQRNRTYAAQRMKARLDDEQKEIEMHEAKQLAAALRGPRHPYSAAFFYLTIEFQHVVVKYRASSTKAQVTKKITSMQQYADFLRSKADEVGLRVGDLIVTCSSTLDFPEEWTNRADVIALCKQLRGGA